MNLASLFELLRIPYTGSPPLPLGNCLDKGMTKYILLGARLKVPMFEVINGLEELNLSFPFPVIVKPSREDSSIGISKDSVVFDKRTLKERVQYIITKHKQPALVEHFIDGKEISVSLIGNVHPKILSISEVDFSSLQGAPKIVTYEGKWETKSYDYINTPILNPSTVCESLKSKIGEISKKAYDIMGCKGYARIDFRIDDSDELFIIDINPNPDISKKAGFSRSAEKSGISYEQLIKRIIDLAIDYHLELNKSQRTILIRKFAKKDLLVVSKLIEDRGIFNKVEIEVALEVINTYLENSDNKYYCSYVADDGINQAIGYICFGPTPLTESTYDIYWITVDRRFQNIGVGSRLLRFAEDYVRDHKGKKIIIETSSKKEYELARSFYKTTGYKEIARISNFYASGDDKIIFEKELDSNRI